MIGVTIQVTQEIAEPLADYLMELGAHSVALQDAADHEIFQLAPEHHPLWSSIELIAHFPQDSSPTEILKIAENHLHLEKPLKYRVEEV